MLPRKPNRLFFSRPYPLYASIRLATPFVLVVVSALNGSLAACAQSDGALIKEDAATSSWLTVELLGWAPYPLRSQGARVGRAWNEDHDMELTYVTGDASILFTKVRVQEAEIRYRTWVSQHIYWAAGLGARRVELDYRVTSSDGADRERVQERQDMLTVGARSGVEFRPWPAVVIGSDLLGFSLPTVQISRSAARFPEDAAAGEEDPRTVPYIRGALSPNYQFLRTYCGVKF